MPTGYTAELCEKEQSFALFALGCARAFGACIEQRESPQNELPKVPEENSYHETEHQAAVAEVARLESMPVVDRIALGKKKRQKEIADCNASIKRKTVVRNRILKMIDAVNQWQPPSPDHVGFKEFMLEQLGTTLNHDGDVEYYKRELNKAKNSTPMSYYDDKVESAKWSVKYHKENMEKEVDRNNGRKEWINALYDSFSNDADLAWRLLKEKDLK